MSACRAVPTVTGTERREQQEPPEGASKTPVSLPRGRPAACRGKGWAYGATRTQRGGGEGPINYCYRGNNCT